MINIRGLVPLQNLKAQNFIQNHYGKETQLKSKHSPKNFVTGFTLIELVLVIIIAGILVAIAIPRFESFYSIKLGSTARKVISDIRYTQRFAMSQDEDYGVEFNSTNETYRVYRVSDNSTAMDPLTRVANSYIIDFNTDPEYGGIDIVSIDFNATNAVRFNSIGTPQDAGGADLASQGEVVLSYNGYTETIIVTPNTGRTVLQ